MTNRREFLIASAAGAMFPYSQAHAAEKQGLQKPELPFGLDALAPVISAETLRLHHGAHHVGYFNTANGLSSKLGLNDLSLTELLWRSNAIKDTSDGLALFNATAQIVNHDIYWRSLTAPGSDASFLSDENLRRRIDRDFGSFAALKKSLTTAAVTQFGSGWAWLVADKRGALSVISTTGADCPIVQGLRPLLTIDVWEHAYYVDYRNKRPDYVGALIGVNGSGALNWANAAAEFAKI